MTKLAPNWLAVALGRDGAPQAPELGSERVKDLIRRALLLPGDLSSEEVQELAAAALGALVRLKGDGAVSHSR